MTTNEANRIVSITESIKDIDDVLKYKITGFHADSPGVGFFGAYLHLPHDKVLTDRIVNVIKEYRDELQEELDNIGVFRKITE